MREDASTAASLTGRFSLFNSRPIDCSGRSHLAATWWTVNGSSFRDLLKMNIISSTLYLISYVRKFCTIIFSTLCQETCRPKTQIDDFVIIGKQHFVVIVLKLIKINGQLY